MGRARPEFDVLAIGGGSAGLAVSISARLLGFRVAQVERHRMGGECLWTGCVPSKALLHAARLAHEARRAVAAGLVAGEPDPLVDFGRVMAHVRAAIATIAPVDSAAAQARRGITVFEAPAALLGEGRVRVGDRVVTARNVVICTGSRPHVPDLPGLREAGYLTNETLFDLQRRPEHLIVLGGGPVGVEMAQAFRRLGSRVTLLQRNRHLLPRDDPEAGEAIRRVLEREGVAVHTGAVTRCVEPGEAAGRQRLRFGVAETELAVEGDAILIAAGRRPIVEGLGLERAGVAVGPDGIVVDRYLRTSAPGVWACGDCVGPYRFTHAAETQGRLIARNLLVPWLMQPIDYRAMPWATFTDPESAHVGLTEAAARERHGARRVRAVRLPLTEVDRAITDDATEGFVKLTLAGGRLVGAQVVAPRAGELVQQLALLLDRRIPLEALSVTHIYPAYAYALHQAGDRASFGLRRGSRALSGALSALQWLARRT